MEQVAFKIDLYSVEHLFRPYRGGRHSQYTGFRIGIDHILYGFSPYLRTEMMELVDNDMVRFELFAVGLVQDQCLESAVGHMLHGSSDRFFDLGNDRHVRGNDEDRIFQMIDDITCDQVGFTCPGSLHDSSDTVLLKAFFNSSVSGFIMGEEFDVFSTFQAFQIAFVGYCQTMQFERKSLRQVSAMCQDAELVAAAHFSDLLHFSVQTVHIRQAKRFFIPYLFHNESYRIFPEANQQTAGFFSYKVIIRMVKIAKGHKKCETFFQLTVDK